MQKKNIPVLWKDLCVNAYYMLDVCVCYMQEFVSWLRRNGPYDIMVDGANVALWGENYEGGGFKAEKIKVMYDTVVAENPDAKVLLVSEVTVCMHA